MEHDDVAAYSTAVADEQTIEQLLLRSYQQRDATPSALASIAYAIVQAQLNAAHQTSLSRTAYGQEASLAVNDPCRHADQHLTGKMHP